MIKTLNINHYRKLNSISVDLSAKINIVSGTNGTCKSSILYLISNSFQEIRSSAEWVQSAEISSVLKSVNTGVNLKIENLTKGDDKYNDPAKGYKGTLFAVEYEDGTELEFRRHNTKISDAKNRFALKPLYKRGTKDRLPMLPVIYLGLSRLYSFGEYGSDSEVKQLRKKLPAEYQNMVSDLYYKFTGIEIFGQTVQEMTQIKKRPKFTTLKDGIDSNTISAGEDNLLIILNALVSLRYYYENIVSVRNTESVLLIDEVDATLHPEFQVKILDLFSQYADQYKIKMVFTTHSLTLLEYAFKKKHNVIYLLDDVSSVRKMDDVDIYKIKMFLSNLLRDELYIDRHIPVFTEDDEARCLLELLFDYYSVKNGEKFLKVRHLFYMVDANISGDTLTRLFRDNRLLKSTMRSICVLDGDKSSNKDYNNYTIALPGDSSPEKIVFEYAKVLFNENSDFWIDNTINDLGYTKVKYQREILPDIERIKQKLDELKSEHKSTKGVEREENKKVFNKYIHFFEFVMKKWIADHPNEVESFFNDMHIMFLKVSEFHDINPAEWVF